MTRTDPTRRPVLEPTEAEWERAHDLVNPDTTPNALAVVARIAYAMAERRVFGKGR